MRIREAITFMCAVLLLSYGITHAPPWAAALTIGFILIIITRDMD